MIKLCMLSFLICLFIVSTGFSSSNKLPTEWNKLSEFKYYRILSMNKGVAIAETRTDVSKDEDTKAAIEMGGGQKYDFGFEKYKIDCNRNELFNIESRSVLKNKTINKTKGVGKLGNNISPDEESIVKTVCHSD